MNRRPAAPAVALTRQANTPVQAPGVEDLVTDDDRLTLPTEDTSRPFLSPRREVGVSPPSAEALEPDWEHLGG